MPFSYCTLGQVKSSGALNVSATTYDTDVARIMADVSRRINDYTKRHFYCYEGIRYFDGSGIMLEFRDSDILSISSFLLDIDGSQNFATTLAATDYVLYPLNKLPKTYAKVSNNSTISAFASNIRQGVKITGVFGYNDSATPYTDSTAVVAAGNITISALTHTLAAGKGALFSPGMTIRIGTEQLYITGVSTDTLTWLRAQNGTAAATHTAGDVLYIYTYPGPIVEAALSEVEVLWKEILAGFATVSGNNLTGEYTVQKGLHPHVKQMLDYYIKRQY